MKKSYIIILVVLVSFMLTQALCFADRGERLVSIGGGSFAGAVAIGGEMLFDFPGKMLARNDIYLRLGLTMADNKNLDSLDKWRKYAPLSLDGVYFISETVYAGAGLNYPLKVSDDRNGDLGYQLFVGMDLNMDSRNSLYSELGYGVLRSLNDEATSGLHLIFGWRYDLIPAKKSEVEIVAPPPSVVQPVIATPAIDTRSEEMERAKTEVRALETELVQVGSYIDSLSEKITAARLSNDLEEVYALKRLKSGAINRAGALKDKISDYKTKYQGSK